MLPNVGGHRPTWAVALMVGVEIVALGILFYLLWIALSGEGVVAGCGEVSGVDCDEVLSSRWSQWLHMPVALPAMFLYMTLLGTTLLAGSWSGVRVRRAAWWLLVTLTATAAGAALWFVYLQLFVVKAICLYCMAAHTCGLVLFGLVLAVAPRTPFQATRQLPQVVLLGRTMGADPAATGRAPKRSAWRPLSYRGGVLAGVCAAGLFAAIQTAVVPKQYTVTADAAPSAPETGPGDTGRPSDDNLQAPPRLPATPVGAAHPSRQPVDPATTTTAEAAPVETALANRDVPQNVTGDGSADEGTPEQPVTPDTSPEGLPDQTPVDDGQARPVAPDPNGRTLTILGGEVTLHVAEQILLGPPAADSLVLTFFDYTCPHCREACQHLCDARQRYGNQLGVILVPVPMNAGCNPGIKETYPKHEYACQYTRLALAVWKHNRTAFPEFHNWLVDGKDPPPPGIAGTRAEKIITDRPLFDAVTDPWVDQHLRACIQLYERYGAGTIPKIVMGGNVVTGHVGSAEQLFELLEQSLGITPRASGQTGPGRGD